MARHDYMSFSKTLEEDDYGLIVSKDGAIKGIWVPQSMEGLDELPFNLASLCETYFGVDPNDDANLASLH